jgi:outer membrane PBP1 activator LpoA protein
VLQQQLLLRAVFRLAVNQVAHTNQMYSNRVIETKVIQLVLRQQADAQEPVVHVALKIGAVKVLRAEHNLERVSQLLRQVFHLHTSQVRHRVHLYNETIVVKNAAEVRVDHVVNY